MDVKFCSYILRFARALIPLSRRSHRPSLHRPSRVVLSLECLELRTLFSATSFPTALLPNPLTGPQPAQSLSVSPNADQTPSQTSSSAEPDAANEIYLSGDSDQSTSESDEYPLPPASSAAQNSNQTPTPSTIPVLLPLIAVEPGTNSSGMNFSNVNVKSTSDPRPPLQPEASIGSNKPGLATQSTVETGFGSSKAAHPDASLALALLFDLTSRSNGHDLGTPPTHSDMESPELTAALALRDQFTIDNITTLNLAPAPTSARMAAVVEPGQPGPDFFMPPRVPGQLAVPSYVHPISESAQPSQSRLFDAPPILEPGIPDRALSLTRFQSNPAPDLDEVVSPTDTGEGMTAEPIPIESSRDGLLFSSLLAVCFSLAGGYGYSLMRSIPEESYEFGSNQ